jgi:Skp family chaperone for outer membrane proteins
MKKILLGITSLMIFSGLSIYAETATLDKDASKLVSIDSILLMQKSKEGQKLAGEIQKEIEEFQQIAKNEQKKLTDFQEEVSKKAKVLSKDVLAEKGEKLASMKKNAERVLGDKEEALKVSIQKKQIALRNKQMKVANEVFEQKKWGMMIDNNTPGVLFVSSAIDKTDEILKAVDEKYGKASEKTIATKEIKKGTDVKGA